MNIDQVKICDLKASEYNPRKLSKKESGDIKKSLSKYGFVDPIIVNKRKDRENIIIGGHQRVKVWKALGNSTVPVHYVDLDQKDEKELNIRLNRNTGSWDWDILIAEFEQPDLIDWGFDPLDFTMETIAPEETEGDDDVPENVEPITVLGDLYELGEHRVLCGDSTLIDSVEKLMDGQMSDMVFTDPPYGISYTKKTKEVFKSKEYTEIKNDDLNKESLKLFFNDSFSVLSAFMKDTCQYYICSPQGGDSELLMMMMMRENGIKCRHQIIWVKDAPVFSMGRLDYDYKHEPILYGWKKKHTFYRKGEQDKSVWEFKRTENKLHPTMKPTELIVNALLNSSIEDYSVLDIFLGSGSTLIACEKTKRKCYGMELDPIYCDIIVKRYIEFCKKNDRKYSLKRNGEVCDEFD
jgi:ParB family chromosome partitioning protein